MSAEFRGNENVSIFEFDNAFSRTTKFVSIAVRSCIEDALDQLTILRSINNRNTTLFEKDLVEYKYIEERVTGTENHANTRLPNIGTNQDKIARDINSLINILRETGTEIRFTNTYVTLRRCINAITAMSNDDKWVLQSEIKNAEKIKRLKHQYAEEKKNGISNLEKTAENIQELKFAVEYIRVYGRLESTYYKNWENTRQEQNTMICNEKEDFYSDIINETSSKTKLEIQSHTKYNDYIEENRNDMLTEINYWVKRYDDEIESREADLIRMRSSLEKLSVAHKEIVEKREKWEREIKEWKEYKKQRRIKRKRAKLEKWASLIIQAWWRGIMVRKNLGPYKSKKGKGKGKK